VFALLTVVALACGGVDEPTSRILGEPPEKPIVPSPPQKPSVPPGTERYGSVVVSSRTSGADLDPDGYIVRTDGEWDYTASPMPIAINGTVTLKVIAAGWHTLTLQEVAPNCRGASLSDRAIVVVAESVTNVVFEVVCKDR
jgi:hypothetical protein